MDDQKKISIEHGIKERRDIVDKYRDYRVLDRDDAINKIRSLRLTDSKVREMTEIALLVKPTPFEKASNEQIVSELQMQITILMAELSELK